VPPCTSRSDDTNPSLIVKSNPCGAPIANTVCPVCNEATVPISTAAARIPGTDRRQRSSSSSAASSLAGSVSAPMLTVNFAPRVATWQLVIIVSRLTTTPLPMPITRPLLSNTLTRATLPLT